VTQVTNLLTGVSGITHLSPALSVARHRERLAFSIYEAGQYNLYVVDSAAVLAGDSLASSLAELNPATLPPRDRLDNDVSALLGNALFGLPAPGEDPEAVKYRGAMSLDVIAPVSAGVSTGAFGTSVGGGSELYWSDMLGRRNLTTLLQVGGSFADVAAVVAYQNLSSRQDWGFIAGQTPVVSLAFRRIGNASNQTVTTDSLFRFRQTDRQLTGVIAHPLSRVQRVELTAGYRASSFDEDVVTRTLTKEAEDRYSQQISEAQHLPAPDAVHQAQASVALVYDNVLFGLTGPVLGQRYRLEIRPSYGTLSYQNVLVDFRRYLMPIRPYTVAGRIMHFGRYGRDADDERLVPLFVGYRSLVRGYDVRSFDLSGCPVRIRQPGDCPVPVFDQLLGSRLLVGNFELRFPLFQGLGLGPRPPGFPPLEMAIFFDAGVAWVGADKPTFLGGDRSPVTSYGAALRMPLFGVAILELDLVHPNDRNRGWQFQIGFTPGF
jgi:hypothetical protein